MARMFYCSAYANHQHPTSRDADRCAANISSGRTCDCQICST